MNKSAVGIAVIVITLFIVHNGSKLYANKSEVEDFSYANLLVNIKEYPNDEGLIQKITLALTDGDIVGEEHRDIVQYVTSNHTFYHGSELGIDHEGSKHQLNDYLRAYR